ncbi:Hsp20/alpha crystallin family protein [Methylomonas sp. MED-D]|uniref:Hsp20/alpha crystallin family protein n=1 Tax=unclassified Methylomonas TaxID=2608980 RepID=UPI000AD94B1F|nr:MULTISPECIES: Hsp20/alpha crystallin family protein [unclassified Methylomonas]MDT4331844.1 Hsp20/alpha crystallin family protein [Methylomonas sp. MV1]WGS88417.1 Hsp20/alpha crystallin family protein [Methylomonas sp. UP202]
MSSLSSFSQRGLFDELFRDISPGYLVRPLHGDPLPSQIKVDIKENPNEFIVEAELAGASKDNIHVRIEGNVVGISADISQIDSQSNEDKLLRSERYYGQVSRSFQLPVDIDQTASKAKYDNGVLTLTLVKSKAKSGQRLTVE